MHRRSIVVVCAASLFAATALSPMHAAAQHSGGGSRDLVAPPEASQFQFLVGMWELQIKPKATTLAARIHGVPKLQGTWKAWRAIEGWGIEDELRIVDAAGNPRTLTHFMRVFDASARRWNVSALDVYSGKFTTSTMQWRGSDMQSISQGTDADGKPYTTRATIGSITPTTFRYQQDRSTDGGRTWTENYLVIEAKRTAATAPR